MLLSSNIVALTNGMLAICCLSWCSTARSETCSDRLVSYSSLLFNHFSSLCSISVFLSILLNSCSKDLLVLFLIKVTLRRCSSSRQRVYFICHLIFRHYFVDRAFNHFGFRNDVFQNCVSNKVHVQRKTICSRIIDLRVAYHHPILRSNWVCYTTSKRFRKDMAIS